MKNQHDQHIGVLDGLRALAVMLVMAAHALEQVWTDFHKPFLPIGHFDVANFFKNGWVGVDLFFILSGFLITGQLLDGYAREEGRKTVISRYLKRRLCRIVPAYYVVLTFTTAVFITFYPVRDFVLQQAHSYIFHLLFMQDFFYVHNYPLFWSLAVEVQFYLLAPFFVLALLRLEFLRWRYAALFCLILLLAVLRTLAVLHWQPLSGNYDKWFFGIKILFPFSLDGILSGMLCSFLWRDEKIRTFLQKKSVCNGFFLSGLMMFLVLTAMRPPLEAGVDLFDKTFLVTIVVLAFSLMLLGLLAGSVGKNLFSSRVLQYIAGVSYSMYLLHGIVVKYIFDLAERLTHSFNGHFAMYFTGLVIFVPVTIFLATLMYELVERPFIEWAKK